MSADDGWLPPVLGEVRALGPGGLADVVHTWRHVWMQGRIERDECIVRVLDDLSFEAPTNVEVYVIEVFHPHAPVPVRIALPSRPMCIAAGDALNIGPEPPTRSP